MTKCADNAVLSVVSPQMRRLCTVRMPGTLRNVSLATEKFTSCGMPKIKINKYSKQLNKKLQYHKHLEKSNLFRYHYFTYLPLKHS